jgi:hypothetical protein
MRAGLTCLRVSSSKSTTRSEVTALGISTPTFGDLCARVPRSRTSLRRTRAPPFRFAARYAASSVSSFTTCTYIPQKRCAGAHFARWPIFAQSSCRLMVGFVIPLLPRLLVRMPPVGPLGSAGVTPLPRYYGPISQALAVRHASPLGSRSYLASLAPLPDTGLRGLNRTFTRRCGPRTRSHEALSVGFTRRRLRHGCHPSYAAPIDCRFRTFTLWIHESLQASQ